MMRIRVWQNISELFNFIRLRIAISLALLAASGYMIFNLPDKMFFVVLAAFFLSCGTYGYNTITDKEEDVTNGRVNTFAFSKEGSIIVSLCFAAGLLLSSYSGRGSTWISVVIIICAVVYSRFRLKRYVIVKNLYTGFAISFFFIIGIVEYSPNVLQYYLIISLFFFIGSIISDLRDCKGDKKANIKTLPVYFGLEITKKTVYILLAFMFFLFLKVDAMRLLPLVISAPIMYVLVLKNRPRLAHFFSGLFIFLLALWLLLLRILEPVSR